MEGDFEEVGEWILEGDKIKCNCNHHIGLKGLVYVFGIGGKVMYVGQTAYAIDVAMGNYDTPLEGEETSLMQHAIPGQKKDYETFIRSKNQKVHDWIREALMGDMGVSIGLLVDNESGKIFCSMDENVRKEKVKDLLTRYQPNWNSTDT